jgi:hypothetical protein
MPAHTHTHTHTHLYKVYGHLSYYNVNVQLLVFTLHVQGAGWNQ